MNDVGYINKRYLFSFIAIFCLLLLFLIIFFYFNIILVLILIAIILISSIVYFIVRNNNEDLYDTEDMVEDEDILEDKIQERDEKFTLELFYVYVKDVIDLISRSYSKKNISFLDNFLGNDLKNSIKEKIDSYTSSGYIRMITGINYRDCKLTDYYISSGYEYFEVDASISKIDCSVQSGVVISGEKTNGKFLDYHLVFCRSLKEYTPVNVVNCSGCGSDSSHFNQGKCLNCGQIVVNMDGIYLIKFDEV